MYGSDLQGFVAASIAGDGRSVLSDGRCTTDGCGTRLDALGHTCASGRIVGGSWSVRRAEGGDGRAVLPSGQSASNGCCARRGDVRDDWNGLDCGAIFPAFADADGNATTKAGTGAADVAVDALPSLFTTSSSSLDCHKYLSNFAEYATAVLLRLKTIACYTTVDDCARGRRTIAKIRDRLPNDYRWKELHTAYNEKRFEPK